MRALIKSHVCNQPHSGVRVEWDGRQRQHSMHIYDMYENYQRTTTTIKFATETLRQFIVLRFFNIAYFAHFESFMKAKAHCEQVKYTIIANVLCLS